MPQTPAGDDLGLGIAIGGMAKASVAPDRLIDLIVIITPDDVLDAEPLADDI